MLSKVPKAVWIGCAVFAGFSTLGFINHLTEDPPLQLGHPTVPMAFSVSAGSTGLEITNKTSVPWDQCTLHLDGGCVVSSQILKANETVYIAYHAFTRADISSDNDHLPDGEGWLRARHGGLDVDCSGDDYERHQATFAAH